MGIIAKHNSLFKSIDPHAVPIGRVLIKFKVYGSMAVQVTRIHPQYLALAVMIQKVQRLTVNETVVDISMEKGAYSKGQA